MRGRVGREVDFLAENNACGQTILQLTSRGNATIAELLRLEEYIPVVFKRPTPRLSQLIFDFGYFRIADAVEEKVDQNQGLQDLDEELRENYLSVLSRFYRVFESVYTYVTDLNRYIEELEEGSYIQQNLESVFQNIDGKQLLTEALYLYGVMLLVLEEHYHGIVRERLLVSYYRYSAQSSSSHSHIDDVCTLLRSSGFQRGGKRPQNYPENLFKRVAVSETYVSLVIGRLRSDDVYNQISAFPLPEHRSAALANQASMLFVALYFAPHILQNQSAIMREIVDKYFPDNWVINIYMGMRINLVEAWEPYKSARLALASTTLDDANVSLIAKRQGGELTKLREGMEKLLNEGTLTKDYVLESTNGLLKAARRSNVTLRWLLLHTAPYNPKYGSESSLKRIRHLRDLVVQEGGISDAHILRLLLLVSQFELKLNEKLKEMLGEKEEKCTALQKDVSERLEELIEVFSGVKPLIRIQKNEHLQKWFKDVREQVDSLEFQNDVNTTGRKIVQLIRALEEVTQFHGLDSNMGVNQFVGEVRSRMNLLLRTLNVREDTLVQLQMISDFSYAWELIHNYTRLMQAGIKEDPGTATQLRAAFLKLNSALSLPLLRVEQARSPDLVSVSQFYSKHLVQFVRKVLQVIPETVFSLLSKIVQLQVSSITELPTRLEKDKIKDYARLNDRYLMAKLTHAISVLTEGVLMMKTTFVGIVKVDPKQVLEDGIRKELVRQVATAMHTIILFNPKAKESELVPKLSALASQIEGFKRSFLYISDYVNLSGLRIWQEEFSRIINYNVEQECNSFQKHKVQDYESVYQSKVIPIPRFPPPPNSPPCENFIGRIMDELLNNTDPKHCYYSRRHGTWYDLKSQEERITPQLFKLLFKAVGNIGMGGLDKLASFMIAHSLQAFQSSLSRLSDANKDLAPALHAIIKPAAVNEQYIRAVNLTIQKLGKNVPRFVELLSKIGQLQALREQFSRELTNASKFESKLLVETLGALNDSLLGEVKGHSRDPSKPYPAESNPLMYEVTAYLEAAGLTDPLKKIYAVIDGKEGRVAGFTMLIVLSQLSKYQNTKNLGLSLKKGGEGVDGETLSLGLATLLHHLPREARLAFLRLIAIQVKASFKAPKAGKPQELSHEAVSLVLILKELTSLGVYSRSDEVETLPATLLDHFSVYLT